jgi:hypothetical protein
MGMDSTVLVFVFVYNIYGLDVAKMGLIASIDLRVVNKSYTLTYSCMGFVMVFVSSSFSLFWAKLNKTEHM